MSPEAHGNFAGKHLVVFGCGYVGGEVARQAKDRGLRVTALTRNAEKAAALRASGVETIVAELGSDTWHAALPDGADYVLDAVSSGGGGIEGYRRSYLEGMKSILAWARAHAPVGTLIYTSSTSVYPQDEGARVDENASIAARDERAAVLVQTEYLLLKETGDAPASEGAGVRPRRFVLRLAGIYGPDRHHLVEQVRRGEVSGRGSHHLNLIHRDDICAAVWAIFGAANLRGDVFNVVDDAPATKAEVVGWLAERLGLPAPRFTGVPAGGRRGVTPDRVILNAKLKAATGWTPWYPSFREGYANLLSR